MKKSKISTAGILFSLLMIFAVFYCELPQDPSDPSNTAVKVLLVNSDWVQNSQAITDTVNKVVQIGVQVNLPENIDSIGITISSAGVPVSDTIIRKLAAGFSDTIWKKISFPTSGKKTVIVTPYSSQNVAAVSATITIVDRIGPLPVNT